MRRYTTAVTSVRNERGALVRPFVSAALVAVAAGGPLTAQESRTPAGPADPVVIGETITIRSEILGEDRRVHVQLPAGYETDPVGVYPVLYVLDGEAPGPFAYVAGLVGFLASGYQLPPMVVVGIPNTDRTRDLTTPHDGPRWYKDILIDPDSVLHPNSARNTGGADAFLRFLTEELTPEIERRYRTAPFRVLLGHSLGGLFVTRALLTRPESFHAYVASSPSLSWNDREIVRDARRALATLPDASRFFYMAVGDRDANLLTPSAELASVLEMHAPPGLRWWYRVNPGETHQSNPVPTYAQGLSTLFADLALPEGFMFTGDLAALEARYASASATYGFRITPPAGFLTFMGTTQLLLGRTDRGIQILERTVELHPQSTDARDALGRALESAGRARVGPETGTDPAPSLVERGDSLFALGRFEGAIELYERAAALHPDRAVADDRLYRSHLALGHFDRAAAWQRRARARGAPARYPGWWHCRLALTAIFRGDAETLAVQTDSLVAVASDDAPESWECAAFNEVYLRRYADARGHLERYVAEAAPEETPLNLGFLHLRAGETEEGERILRQAEARARAAAAEAPDSWEPRFELAEIAAMRGDADVAVRHLTAAVERGLGRKWWVFHLFSRESLPDPVFEPLYGHSGFERLRAEFVAERRLSHDHAAEPGYESRLVQVRGIRMHYLDFGGSGLPVIFIHGSHANARSFVDFAPRFADAFRVLALDRPGHGESENVDWGHGTGAQAEDILGFMDALGLERAVLIDGNVGLTTYLGEHHPDRLEGIVFLRHMAPEVESRRDSAVAVFWDMASRTACDWDEETRRRNTQRDGYRPHFIDDPDLRIDVPALSLANADGTRHQADFDFVGIFLEQVETGEWCDTTAKAYFSALAADTARATELRNRLGDLTGAADLSAFERAFGPRMAVVRLSVPAVTGYEYLQAPDLIYPPIRKFLEGLEESGTDTVRVAPPTAEAAADRASILAALEAVQPGGTVLFQPGTYRIGEFISVSVPAVTLQGHPDGTTLRGCEPADLVDHDRVVAECNGLELIGDRQTIRDLTFEQMGHALWVGCCLDPASPGEEAGQPHVGGHLIEGNTFRGTWNGIRVIGDSPEAALIRDNDFVNTWHAVTVNGRTAHILGNRVSVPDPGQVPVNGHAGIAIAVSAHDTRLERAFTCAGNVIAGNRIEGHPEGIGIFAFQSAASCRENVIRDNTIAVSRARMPGPSWGVIGIREQADSTLAGVPIALADLSAQMAEFLGLPAGDYDEDLIHDNRIEGNRVEGAEGLAIQVLGASRNQVADNVIAGVRRREPFPGNTMIDNPELWREANGSGIWISPGSDGNEIVGNTFDDVASAAVVLEGDSNVVVVHGEAGAVRDLGKGNHITRRSRSVLSPEQDAILSDSILALTRALADAWIRLDADDFLRRFSDDLVFYYEGERDGRAMGITGLSPELGRVEAFERVEEKP
jgi:uncharacterized protein